MTSTPDSMPIVYHAAYKAVLSYIATFLDREYATNPELVDRFIAETQNIDELLPIEFVEIEGGALSGIEISDRLEALSLEAEHKVYIVELEYTGQRVFEGWFLRPGGLRAQSRRSGWDAITTLHIGTQSKESLLNASLFRNKFVSALVYLAREEYSRELKLRNNLNALKHKDIFSGSKIKNIRVGGHGFSTVIINEVHEKSDASPLPYCVITASKRGSSKRWTGTVNPADLVLAIHNRDKLNEKKDTVSIDLRSGYKVSSGGAINSQRVLV